MEDLFRNASRNGANGKSPEPAIVGNTHVTRINQNIHCELKIEKNIPLEPHGRHYGREKKINPLAVVLNDLEVGDSVYVPAEIAKRMRNTMQYVYKQDKKRGIPRQFVTRGDKQNNPAFRVWRMK